MVLEQIYSPTFLQEHPAYTFLLGVTYALIGLGASILLFPEDPALVAVAITAILFLPSMYNLAVKEEEQEQKERKFDIIKLIKRQHKFIKVYVYAFFGIFAVFSFFSLILPSLAANHLFREQLNILSSVGGAVFSKGLFLGLLSNNFKIFLLCFLISLILGNGAIFIIAWNASVWGTIFGTLANSSAIAVGKNPFIYFILILFSVFPHMVLEILAYILAIIAGTLISEGILREKFGSEKMDRVMRNNLLVLVIGVLILILAALVETYTLNNVETYRIIIQQSFLR